MNIAQVLFRVAKRYDMWTDLTFGRLLGVKRFREHTIDLFGDIDGKVVLDGGCDTGRTFSFLLPRGCRRTHHRRVLLARHAGRRTGAKRARGMAERAI